MLKFIKSLFGFTRATRAEKIIKDDPTASVMFFDGDNISSKDFKLFINMPHDKRYITVATTTPNVVRKAGIQPINPLNIGKEASDMLIAMLAMEECCMNKNLKELYIVSTDGDMVELLATLAMKFNHIKFTLFSKVGKPMSTNAVQAMRNIESVNFRYFSTTSVL